MFLPGAQLGMASLGIAQGAEATAAMMMQMQAAMMFQLMLAIQEMILNIVKKGSNAAANAIG